MNKLNKYRESIDEIDEKIIKLLALRFDTVKLVWEYKKKNWIVPLQQSRWEEVLKDRKKIAREEWISDEVIEKIWNIIHDFALWLENEA